MDFATKNHQGGINDRQAPGNAGRIQEGNQVFAIDMFLSKLNPLRDELFQRPKPDSSIKKGELVWYQNTALGKNTLGRMMQRYRISALGKNTLGRMMQHYHILTVCELSKDYTNHTMRATAVSRLQRSGLSTRAIMSVTGHRSAVSLQAYAVPSEE